MTGFGKISTTGSFRKSKRKTCTRLEKTNEMTSASRSDKFDVVNLTERGLEVEEVTWCKRSWRSLSTRELSRACGRSERQGVTRTDGDEDGEAGRAASGSPVRVEGNARLELVRDGKKCNMKFLDSDVKRPLASVSAMVDEGNVVVFGPHESYVESTSTGQWFPMKQEARRVCGAAGRTSWYKMSTKTVDSLMIRTRNAVFRRPA